MQLPIADNLKSRLPTDEEPVEKDEQPRESK
jgi:hypothetical protein